MLDSTAVLRTIADEHYFPNRLGIRSQKTVAQYGFAFNNFDTYLKRPGTIGDLNENTLSRFMRWLLTEKKLAAKTVNERAGRITALWGWLAKRRMVDMFPTVERVLEPKRAPRAWTLDQINRIHLACGQSKRLIDGVPAGIWMQTLVAFVWCTGERIGAVTQMKWDMVDWERGTIHLPAEIRKKGQCDAVYSLWPEVLEMLRSLRLYNRKFIFNVGDDITWLYIRYKKILIRAGLPTGRKSMFHAIRVSHATWIKAGGGDATAALRHANPATTQKHYIDTSIASPGAPDLARGWLPTSFPQAVKALPPAPEVLANLPAERIVAKCGLGECELLSRAADALMGEYFGVPASLSWRGRLAVWRDTNAQFLSINAAEWGDLDSEMKQIKLTIRGGRGPGRLCVYDLAPDTTELLKQIRTFSTSAVIFAYPFTTAKLSHQLNALRRELVLRSELYQEVTSG